ncbi:hypothetical protein PFISCL1PPCAC_22939 [Pristionchus fissidentatus]|uniref:Ribosomal protein n=1 Tax=Pristionchus fissidentatus TaxID=1538716 RepID=A0AAV5WI85_9BILA|nr:hypothetical protein PFISCL1PPCAC_22939 [Pristionchus fissidentatus]
MAHCTYRTPRNLPYPLQNHALNLGNPGEIVVVRRGISLLLESGPTRRLRPCIQRPRLLHGSPTISRLPTTAKAQQCRGRQSSAQELLAA